MAQDFGQVLDQLTLLEVDHEPRMGQQADCFQGIVQDLLTVIPEDGYVVQEDHYGELTFPWVPC